MSSLFVSPLTLPAIEPKTATLGEALELGSSLGIPLGVTL